MASLPWLPRWPAARFASSPRVGVRTARSARPAANFVKTAIRFRSRVTVGVNGKIADAKSILAVLALGATGGTVLKLNAEGEDASAALDALAACVSGLVE